MFGDDRPPAHPDRRPLLARPELKPEERKRIGQAVVPLLAWGLSATVILAGLTIWHLIRKGRRLRSNLGLPRVVRFPEVVLDPRPETLD